MEGGFDRVRVDVAGEIVEISWNERDAVLNQLAYVAGSHSVRERFEAVGASRSINLNPQQRARLREALDDWDRGNLPPDGISRLRDALVSADPFGGKAA